MYRELKVCEDDLKDNLADIMKHEFPDDVLEIRDAMDRVRRDNYDYRTCFVPVLTEDNKVCAGGICVKHQFLSENKSKIHVWEIIWFATDNTIRSKKYGTKLFQKLHSKNLSFEHIKKKPRLRFWQRKRGINCKDKFLKDQKVSWSPST